MDIVPKNTGDSLTAAEFNQIVDELENLITDSGQTPNQAILVQVARAVIELATVGQFYNDVGAADAYTLATLNGREGIGALLNGQRVRFIADNDTTGGPATVGVNALAVKSIKKFDGASFIDPVAGDIDTDVETELRYDQGNDF